MATPLRDYWGQLWAEQLKAAMPWARDNIGWAVLFLIVPPIAVLARNKSVHIDWDIVFTSLWIYGGVAVVYAIYHIIKAVWKVDLKRQRLISTQASSIAELRRKLDSLKLDSLHWRAATLCKEINDFVSSLGPMEEYKYDSGMSGPQFEQVNAAQIAREQKMEAGFYRRFTERVVNIYNEFCEQGMSDPGLEQALRQKMDNHENVNTVVNKLSKMAAQSWVDHTIDSHQATS